VRLYPTRGSVPVDLWRSLIEDARDSFDLLAYGGLFLPDTNPDMAETLARKAANGVRVRILLGDPRSEAVRLRGEEEGIREGLAERIRIVLNHLTPVLDTAGMEVRLHATTLYNSIFRSDGVMLVNCHVYGAGAPSNPVLHLQRVAGGRMFDHYQTSFQRVWDTGRTTGPAPTQRGAHLRSRRQRVAQG
jgi:hypothetical protein